jgi:hypothetical protein
MHACMQIALPWLPGRLVMNTLTEHPGRRAQLRLAACRVRLSVLDIV